MNKKILALLSAAVMLFSLTACNAGEPTATEPTTKPATTEPTTTEPAAPETFQIISQVRWLVDTYVEEIDCQYDEKTNTLSITGEGIYPVEVLFFEGAKQVKKQTVLDDEGQIYTQQEYDEERKLIYEQDDYGYRRFYEYDGKLLIRETAYEEGDQPYSVKTWTYDDAGREISYTEEAEGGNVSEEISHTYDEEGNLIAYRLDSFYEDNHWYQVDTYTYDSGRLIKSTHEGDDPANAWDYSVAYSYDDQGRRVSALRTDEFYGVAEDVSIYDENDKLIRAVEHYQMDGWVETLYEYTYDDAGTVVREHYKESYPSSGEVFYWETTEYTHDSKSSLHPTSKIITNSNEEVYAYYNEYDEEGKLIEEYCLLDGEELYRKTYTYDTNGDLVKIDLDGQEVLSGEIEWFLNSEVEVECYISAQYKDTADAEEAAAVNDFILQYIREQY